MRIARRGQRLMFSLLLVAALAPMSVPGVGHSESVQGSLTISPASGPLGGTFHVHGTGFVNFSLITHQLDLSISDGSQIVDGGSVLADDDGNIDTEITTDDGKYTSGTYQVLASYTYWGTRRDANQRVICTFCPISTVPLAELVYFTIQ